MSDSKTFRRHKWVAGIVILLGFLTLLYGIIVEDEPTAVALLPIVGGAAWLLTSMAMFKKRKD